MAIRKYRTTLIALLGILTILASCATTEQRPVAERDDLYEESPPHEVDRITSFDSSELWSAAHRGDPMAVIAHGVPAALEPIVVSRTQGVLSRTGFTIVERHARDALLDELTQQLEPLYEESTALRLGAWLQSNLLAIVSVQLLRTSPAVAPRDSRNYYYSPQTEIAVYNLSSRKKILSIAVHGFQTTEQMTESAALSAILEYLEEEFVRLQTNARDTQSDR